MATETFVDFTGLQYYDGKLKEKIASEYATKSELPSSYQGATSSANGVAGLVPAAPSADRDKFLKGDGTWKQVSKEVGYSTTEPTSSSIASLDNESVVFYETQNMSSGAASPAPISITGNAATADSVSHSMSISVDGGAIEGASLYTFNGSAEKTVNIAGGTGISLTGVSGTVTINANPFRGATASVNGAAGMVPASTVAEKDRFLRGDGTWAEVVQPAIVTSSELSTGTDATVRTISPKVIHDYVAGEVASGVAGLVNSAPAALDTLNELASALGNDANFATTVSTNIGTKVSKTGNETIDGVKTFSSTISGSIDGNAATATKATQDASGNVITTTYATKAELPADYVGATSSANGTHGLVPAAPSADKDKFLKGDGTWAEVVQPAIVTSSELSTGTDATVRTISPKVIHDYVAEVDSNAVHTTGNETIAGVKTFTTQITSTTSYFRSIGNIDKTATGTGEQEAVIFNTADKNNVAICQLNAERNLAGAFQELRFRNWNINNLWSDFRLRCTDDNKYWLTMAAKDGMSFGLEPTDSSLAIPTTAWIRSATGNFALNAATATKATQDASGNVITTTYATKSELPADYVGATANANGTHGLVPAATSAEKDNFLCADGTWDSITGMTNAQIDTAMANVGYVGNIDPSLLTTITNSEIDALFA